MKNSHQSKAYAGLKDVCNMQTGEIERAVIVKNEYKDRNYIKLFLPPEGSYDMRPREMALATVHLFDYFCVIAGKDNLVVATLAEMQDHTKYGASSIFRAKDQLKRMDYIRQKAANIYMINPEVAAKIKGDDRAALCEAYQHIKRKG